MYCKYGNKMDEFVDEHGNIAGYSCVFVKDMRLILKK